MLIIKKSMGNFLMITDKLVDSAERLYLANLITEEQLIEILDILKVKNYIVYDEYKLKHFKNE